VKGASQELDKKFAESPNYDSKLEKKLDTMMESKKEPTSPAYSPQGVSTGPIALHQRGPDSFVFSPLGIDLKFSFFFFSPFL
jgi:hypothetical protein